MQTHYKCMVQLIRGNMPICPAWQQKYNQLRLNPTFPFIKRAHISTENNKTNIIVQRLLSPQIVYKKANVKFTVLKTNTV